MKLWIDDVRPAPRGYSWAKSVNQAKEFIEDEEWCVKHCGMEVYGIDLIDIGSDAGEYAYDGGDYIKLLNWLEETGRDYPIHIHSKNQARVEDMRRIINRNGWKEVE